MGKHWNPESYTFPESLLGNSGPLQGGELEEKQPNIYYAQGYQLQEVLPSGSSHMALPRNLFLEILGNSSTVSTNGSKTAGP